MNFLFKRASIAIVKTVILVFCLFIQVQGFWQVELDGEIKFYQTTDFGIVLAGTERLLYGIDGKTGEILWRKSYSSVDETSVAIVPGTDLILVSLDIGERARIEAVDLLSGNSIWLSDRIKGDVLQLAVEPQEDLLVAVSVRKTKGKLGERVMRSPVLHVLRLSDGKELWQEKLESNIEMMPSSFDKTEVLFTLDNYRPPIVLDGKVFAFYEGVTVYDTKEGKKLLREKFKVNEEGLALTDADLIYDENFIYVSGRGKIRAIRRADLKVEWDSKDLGVCAEMALLKGVLYVRTGGRFTRLEDGQVEERGPFGISAVDTKDGKTLWRFKGADKGITNFVFADEDTLSFADKDDLIVIDAKTGKKKAEIDHKVKQAQFVLVNESRELVVGGSEELAAFKVGSDGQLAVAWRVKHSPPSRGILGKIAKVALRATAIYFRYAPTSSFLGFFRGASLSQKALRWSGLKFRFSSFDLTTLATNSINNQISKSVSLFGVGARFKDKISGLQVIERSGVRGRVVEGGSVFRDNFFRYLSRRADFAKLRNNHIYFYTDLPKPYDEKGLIGINVHTGKNERFITVSDPDLNFVIDDEEGLFYQARGNKLQALRIEKR
ncbi:MAG: PQQ-like beta-propeller repeat protein [Pyrinomonadaceae bacterium]|nr:PQQ-like beta-propeller repeat protein [Pyrinomonadaceae bacterium]